MNRLKEINNEINKKLIALHYVFTMTFNIITVIASRQ